MKRGNILALVMIVFMGVFISGSILFYQVSKVSDYRDAIAQEPFKMDLTLMYDRITSEPKCVAYEDKIVVPNSIELDRLTNENLDVCINNDPRIPQQYPSVLVEVLANDRETVEHSAQTSNFVRYKLETITLLTNIYVDGKLIPRYVRVTGSPGLK